MIKFSERLRYLLAQEPLESFYLVQVDSYLTTSYFRDLVFQGNLYSAHETISALDPPVLDSSADRELYTLQLADPGFARGAEAEANLIGKRMQVILGLVDNATGLPDTTETLLVYRGVIESCAYEADTSEVGEVKLVVKGSSPMIGLDTKRPFYSSRDYLRQRRIDDSAFDQVYEGSGVVNLKWGKT